MASIVPKTSVERAAPAFPVAPLIMAESSSSPLASASPCTRSRAPCASHPSCVPLPTARANRHSHPALRHPPGPNGRALAGASKRGPAPAFDVLLRRGLAGRYSSRRCHRGCCSAMPPGPACPVAPAVSPPPCLAQRPAGLERLAWPAAAPAAQHLCVDHHPPWLRVDLTRSPAQPTALARHRPPCFPCLCAAIEHGRGGRGLGCAGVAP